LNEDHKRSNKSKHRPYVPRRYSLEEQKLLGKKSRARRADPTRQRRPRKHDWQELDEEVELFERLQTGRDRVRLSAAAPHEQPEPDTRGDESAPAALVLCVQRGSARVLLEGEIRDAELAEHIALSQQTRIAVGDEALVRVLGDGSLRVESVRARRTVLSRPDPANPHRERVLAANVDLAVLVLAAREPAFRPALIDRLLIALERGGVRALVCVNKIDLLEPLDRERIERQLDPYRELEATIVLASAVSGEGMACLRERLAGRTCVFVGHSGVGKSTLLNAIDPEHERAIRSGREHDGKGRHTTTSSTLVELSDGTRVIDTPGIRSFGLWRVDRDELREHIPELVEHAPACRFRDCSHVHEPSCAVREAVSRGDIPAARYQAYLRILESLE
jgi:ribosome biogenesis GTPase